MFITVPELERNAYWRFYKTKRGIAFTLQKQIFEKYFLCCIKQGSPCHWSDPTDHLSEQSSRLQMFFKKSFLKISPISQKNTCAGVSFHCEIGEILRTPLSYRTPQVATSDLPFVQIPKLQRTYSLVSTVFFTSPCSSYFIWRNHYMNYNISYVIARSRLWKKRFQSFSR